MILKKVYDEDFREDHIVCDDCYTVDTEAGFNIVCSHFDWVSSGRLTICDGDDVVDFDGSYVKDLVMDKGRYTLVIEGMRL